MRINQHAQKCVCTYSGRVAVVQRNQAHLRLLPKVFALLVDGRLDDAQNGGLSLRLYLELGRGAVGFCQVLEETQLRDLDLVGGRLCGVAENSAAGRSKMY